MSRQQFHRRKTHQGFAELAERYGFRLRKARVHLQWVHPAGGIVVTPKTPSDHRSLRNAERDFKRQSGK